MTPELVNRENAEGETEYFLISPELKKEIDLKTIIYEEIINDCNWLDEEETFLEVQYNDWDNNEMVALVSAGGELLRKGIKHVVEYIPTNRLFIIAQTGDSLGEERFDYMTDEDDHVYAVINQYGEYVISPQHEEITFDDYENIFEIGIGENYARYDLLGNVAE